MPRSEMTRPPFNSVGPLMPFKNVGPVKGGITTLVSPCPASPDCARTGTTAAAIKMNVRQNNALARLNRGMIRTPLKLAQISRIQPIPERIPQEVKRQDRHYQRD